MSRGSSSLRLGSRMCGMSPASWPQLPMTSHRGSDNRGIMRIGRAEWVPSDATSALDVLHYPQYPASHSHQYYHQLGSSYSSSLPRNTSTTHHPHNSTMILPTAAAPLVSSLRSYTIPHHHSTSRMWPSLNPSPLGHNV
ncbi:hypothetical protein PIB30_045666 [Stylosanthes scabra]|uniref:Uncharacterized protein n=1 Tax=Stylosanthes scabra TaxID=79078 RepID=A0ABU6QFU6_9FABA|nr:hypothetical protein [Stylosanthes scabra]